MMIFKCNNPLCEFRPCFLRSDKSCDIDCIIKPTACPHENEDVAWKPMPYTVVNFGTMETLADWEGGEGWDKMPEKTRDIIDGLFLFDTRSGRNAEKIAQTKGLMKEFEASQWQKAELLEEIKKMDKVTLLDSVFLDAFRAGMIYAEYLRIEKEPFLTRYDNEEEEK